MCVPPSYPRDLSAAVAELPLSSHPLLTPSEWSGPEVQLSGKEQGCTSVLKYSSPIKWGSPSAHHGGDPEESACRSTWHTLHTAGSTPQNALCNSWVQLLLPKLESLILALVPPLHSCSSLGLTSSLCPCHWPSPVSHLFSFSILLFRVLPRLVWACISLAPSFPLLRQEHWFSPGQAHTPTPFPAAGLPIAGLPIAGLLGGGGWGGCPQTALHSFLLQTFGCPLSPYLCLTPRVRPSVTPSPRLYHSLSFHQPTACGSSQSLELYTLCLAVY